MGTLIARRLLALIPILLVVSFGVFMLVSLVPGDVAITLAGGESATPERIAEVREELHLDGPIIVQYARWLGGAVRLDFGTRSCGGRRWWRTSRTDSRSPSA